MRIYAYVNRHNCCGTEGFAFLPGTGKPRACKSVALQPWFHGKRKTLQIAVNGSHQDKLRAKAVVKLRGWSGGGTGND